MLLMDTNRIRESLSSFISSYPSKAGIELVSNILHFVLTNIKK
jgi:hypothetical protein